MSKIITDLDKALNQLRNKMVTTKSSDSEAVVIERKLREISSSLDEDGDDSEAHDMFGELADLFQNIAKDKQYSKVKKIVSSYNQTISWDNYTNDDDDADEAFYTLGGVWYQRLSWFQESDNEELSKFSKQIEKPLVKFMDLLEKAAA